MWRQAWQRRELSLATAMRALAVVALLVACSLRARALDHVRDRDFHSQLLETLGLSQDNSIHRLLRCARAIGPAKCWSALNAWRAENAITNLEQHSGGSNFAEDIKQFPWEQYANTTQEQIYSQLCHGTEKLLKIRTMTFNMIPDYEFKLASNGNGTLSVDVLHSQQKQSDAARGMKKLRKKFYNIVPYLLLPGLIMSAILPFVLPALKMMVMGVGMLNNMALSSAVFTLLRNNAFNDNYKHKVIYVNEGYHNEKEVYANDHEAQYNHQAEVSFDGSKFHETSDYIKGNDYDIVEESPDLAQHYMNVGFTKDWAQVHKRRQVRMIKTSKAKL